ASGLQTLTDASGRPQREEEEEESKGKAVENADGPQAGVSHKKRYPTVNEIEVIGGYLSLERSCMSKTGSRRKKVTAWGVSVLNGQAGSSWDYFWLVFPWGTGWEDGQHFSGPFGSQRLALGEGALGAGPRSRWEWDVTCYNCRASPTVTSRRCDNRERNMSGI
uniref:Phostensin/Taperin PP1-binding domain-containing protein n=1 Tax=Calidris pygmaea TaxID=425635 RepID=A0A8C3JGT6_9CHAR